MDVEKVDYYGACDRAIKAMNRENVEAFGRLKMAKWDEIRVIQVVTKVYTESARKARKRYYEVAFEAYLLMLELCGIRGREAHRMAEKAITPEWVDDVLAQTDFVTLYRFDTETDRKAVRLAETLEVVPNRNEEIDKALRYWSLQVGQYAINVTDYAMLQAMEDAGVEFAEWVTMGDEKVCGECHVLNGQVFRVDEWPSKPHLRCRCRMRPVFRHEEVD